MKANGMCLPLSLALALTVSAADAGRGITVAPVSTNAPSGNAGLFVGVNKFIEDTSLRPLAFAVNDAVAQAHLFVVGLKLIPLANCYIALSGEPTTDVAKGQLMALLLGGAHRMEATKTSSLRALLTVVDMAQDERDLAVVSLSSHGFEKDGVAYAMPTDGLRGVLEDTAISLNTVEQRLLKSKAGKRLLLVDACRENPTTDRRGDETAMSSAFRKALGSAKGQAVLASCDVGQLSIENPELGHGVFTYFLLKALHGEATADARGYITLGTVSDYVAKSVHDWVVRNKPATDQRLVQQPWFKGPKIAEQIPLAMDPGIRARVGVFKNEVAQTVDGLRTKINRKGEFSVQVYDRLAEALEKAEDDDAGHKLLQHSKDFLAGKIGEDLFVSFLEQTLKTPEQRQAMERPPETANQVPKPDDTNLKEEFDAYVLLQANKSEAGMKAFVERFPQGPHAKLVKAELEKMQQEHAAAEERRKVLASVEGEWSLILDDWGRGFGRPATGVEYARITQNGQNISFTCNFGGAEKEEDAVCQGTYLDKKISLRGTWKGSSGTRSIVRTYSMEGALSEDGQRITGTLKETLYISTTGIFGGKRTDGPNSYSFTMKRVVESGKK